MTRAEFSKATKRAAYLRSEGWCEAVGKWYGMPLNKRCSALLISSDIQYDHIVLDANSHDNSLENCAAVCSKCHRWKTAHHDIPLAAKTLRQQDKHRGIKGPKRTWPSRKIQSSQWGK